MRAATERTLTDQEAFKIAGGGLRSLGPVIMVELDDEQAAALKHVFKPKVRGRSKAAVTRVVWVVSESGLTGVGNVLTLTPHGLRALCRRLDEQVDAGWVAPDDIETVVEVVRGLRRLDRAMRGE